MADMREEQYQAALKFIQDNGYPMGWKSREDYESWLEKVSNKNSSTSLSAKYLHDTGKFEVKNKYQGIRADYLQNYDLTRHLYSTDIYEELVSRPEYSGLTASERSSARGRISKSVEGKTYDSAVDRLQAKYFTGRALDSNTFLMPEGEWNKWYVNNNLSPKDIDPAYRTHVGLKDPLNLTEDQMDEIVKRLEGAGYKGQINTLVDSGYAGTRIENLVFQAYDAESSLQGAEIAHRVLGENVDNIWSSVDAYGIDSTRKLAENINDIRRSKPKVPNPAEPLDPSKRYTSPKVKTTPLGSKVDRTSTLKGVMGDAAKEAAEEVVDTAKQKAIKAAKSLPDWALKAGMIGGGIIAAGTLLHTGIKYADKERERQQLRVQENDRKKRDEKLNQFDYDLYSELNRLNGLPQQLYGKRTGHSNTWGGKRY